MIVHKYATSGSESESDGLSLLCFQMDDQTGEIVGGHGDLADIKSHYKFKEITRDQYVKLARRMRNVSEWRGYFGLVNAKGLKKLKREVDIMGRKNRYMAALDKVHKYHETNEISHLLKWSESRKLQRFVDDGIDAGLFDILENNTEEEMASEIAYLQQKYDRGRPHIK